MIQSLKKYFIDIIFNFSDDKNAQLIKERKISFEEIIAAINDGELIDVLPHPKPDRYPNQSIYVVNINSYIYAVPFVKEDQNTIFLKTIIPHRKLNRKYLGNNSDEKT